MCEHHLLPRLGSPVEKGEGEQLMRRRVPSLKNKRAVIFGLHEEESLTALGCRLKEESANGILKVRSASRRNHVRIAQRSARSEAGAGRIINITIIVHRVDSDS